MNSESGLLIEWSPDNRHRSDERKVAVYGTDRTRLTRIDTKNLNGVMEPAGQIVALECLVEEKIYFIGFSTAGDERVMTEMFSGRSIGQIVGATATEDNELYALEREVDDESLYKIVSLYQIVRIDPLTMEKTTMLKKPIVMEERFTEEEKKTWRDPTQKPYEEPTIGALHGTLYVNIGKSIAQIPDRTLDGRPLRRSEFTIVDSSTHQLLVGTRDNEDKPCAVDYFNAATGELLATKIGIGEIPFVFRGELWMRKYGSKVLYHREGK